VARPLFRSIQCKIHRGDNPDFLEGCISHTPAARFAIARIDGEIALRGLADTADIGTAVLGELFGSGARVWPAPSGWSTG